MADIKESSQNMHELQEYNKGTLKYLRLLVHSIGAGHFVYATFQWKDFSRRENWGGQFKFLTYLSLLLNGAYHSIAFLNDLFGSNAISLEPLPILRKVRDITFSVLAFPISHNVCLSFWIIYAFDRELIYPRALDPFIPRWLNHIAHTNVAVFCVMDMLTCFRQYPKRKYGVLFSSLAMLSYVGWLHIAYYLNGRWPYPILNVLSGSLRYVALSAFVGINIAFYFCGELLNNIIWTPAFKVLQK